MMAGELPNIRFQASSRLPVLGRDYDPKSHRYQELYINPAKYTVLVSAFPGVEPGGIPPTPMPGVPPLPPIKRLKVPADTVAFDFSVSGVGVSFSSKVSHPTKIMAVVSPNVLANPWNWQISLPSQGVYDFTATFRNSSGGGPRSTRRLTLKDHLVVSIGDSNASGQGNPDIPGAPEDFDPDLDWWDVFVPSVLLFKLSKEAIEWSQNQLKKEFTTASRKWDFKLAMDPRPVWLEEKAYRSLRSGPAMAARRLEDLNSGRLVTFLSFARSGSEIKAGLIGPRDGGDGWIGGIGQIREIERTVGKRTINALTVSIGVNDIGGPGSLKDLVASDIGNDDASAREALRNRVTTGLAALAKNLPLLDKALGNLNIDHVFLTEYPNGLFDRADGSVAAGCGIFTSIFDLDLTRADARVVKESVDRLNAALAGHAAKLGWTFISGISKAFSGHGYCVTGAPRFFVQAEESMAAQGDTEGTVHPNQAGHEASGRIMADSIRKQLGFK
jgi:lysophospholipase L1-like esterase